MLGKLPRFSQQLKCDRMDGAVALFGNNPDAPICSEVFHARALFSGEHYSVKTACIHAGPASGALVIQNRGFAFELYGAKRTDFLRTACRRRSFRGSV